LRRGTASRGGVRVRRFRTWPVVALALLGLLALIFVSIMAARSKADAAYAELDSLHARYLNVETRLRRVRANLQLSGILVRDYLLDINAPNAEYRSRLMELRNDSARLLGELKPLVRDGDPVRYDSLRSELDDYWNSYGPIFEGMPEAERYNFLQREVMPRRDAVMAISAEIETINNTNLIEQREEAAARQHELHEYLTRMLGASLFLGAIVAAAGVVRIQILERRSEQQHARTEQAEQEMRRLSNQLVKTQEEERKNLSRELHDELGQMLTALRMEVGRAERAQASGSPAFAATMAESKALIEKMMRLVRDLAMGLRPSMLDDLGLEPALAWQTRDFARRYNVPVNLSVEGDLERLPDPHRTCVFRVVQEALTNCAKHSGATQIDISVVGLHDQLDVSVGDNGVGIARPTGHTGLGLTGIKERVKEMHGSASIQTKPGGGTVLHITLPIPAADGSKESGLAHSAR
jgi:signal transduction histidine kinase